MVIENKLTKALYRRLILRDLVFERKSTFIVLLLYVLLWRILYSITEVGQLKTNIPIFVGISFLLLLMFIRIFVVYRKHLKKDFLFQAGSQIEFDETQLVVSNATDRHVFPLNSLTTMKENKNWYFLYFRNKTFIPISKKTEHSPEQIYIKPIRPSYWKWSVILFSLSTVIGAFFVGSNAVNFNGALAWKIQELKTDTTIKLENDNFYTTKLEGIIDSVKEKMELEPYLMTNDLEIEFDKDGTITDIYMYIYAFDENKKLQSGYLIYADKKKDNKVKVHKQDWHGEGTKVYDLNNDLSIVINMLKWIPVKDEVKRWNEENYAVLYKGIRNWSNLEGIRFIDKNGKISIPSVVNTAISGPTISLYIPGKEDRITPQRYVYQPF